MPRILLISRNGNSRKTYGVVDKAEIMKFPFIIGVFLWCCLQGVQSRVVNERQYLEYLNDLDRRNVEIDDIHHQWPFYSTVNDAQDNLGASEDPEENPVLAELTNRLKNYRDRTPDNLNQYRRHKPLDSDSVVGLARVFPEPDDEEEPELTENDDNVYADVNSDKDEEELNRPHHHTPIFTSFPRIVIEQPNNFEHTYANIYGTEETEEQPEADEEEIIRPKPTFSPSYFPRIVVPDFKVNINDLDFGTKDSHSEEEYTFKPGEEFPQTIDFDKVPVPKDLAEFGVGPADPRFGREFLPPGDMWDYAMTPAPPREAVGRTYLLKTPSVSKPKMNSRSDLHQYDEPSDEVQLETFVNKDVEMVPFKPDTENDSAGVYLIAVVAGISAAATVGLIAVGIGWYNLQKHMKNAEDSDYPSYGIVGPNKDYEKKERNDAGDRKLAQSAQMYHYQHQKQQIIAMGRNNHQGHGPQSDSEEEEDEEGNYTVYECPGLASIEGPLEVKNPMFDDDQLATPSQTPSKNDK